MSYDSDPSDPPFDPASMTPLRADAPWLRPLEAAQELGIVEEHAGEGLTALLLRMRLLTIGAEGTTQAWRAAIELSVATLSEALGPIDGSAIDDLDGGMYCGGWGFERGSLMVDSTEVDVTVTVSQYRPTSHWTWQLTGPVSPPYAPLTPLPVAVREALARLAAIDPGARRRGT